MATGPNGERPRARYGDQEVATGHGGETHQSAGDGRQRLTTQQGAVVGDGQNTLRAGERGPGLLEDFHLRQIPLRFWERQRVAVM